MTNKLTNTKTLKIIVYLNKGCTLSLISELLRNSLNTTLINTLRNKELFQKNRIKILANILIVNEPGVIKDNVVSFTNKDQEVLSKLHELLDSWSEELNTVPQDNTSENVIALTKEFSHKLHHLRKNKTFLAIQGLTLTTLTNAISKTIEDFEQVHTNVFLILDEKVKNMTSTGASINKHIEENNTDFTISVNETSFATMKKHQDTKANKTLKDTKSTESIYDLNPDPLRIHEVLKK